MLRLGSAGNASRASVPNSGALIAKTFALLIQFGLTLAARDKLVPLPAVGEEDHPDIIRPLQ